MRRIDQQGDLSFAQKGGKPFGAAEAADARRKRLRAGIGGTAGKRDRRIVMPFADQALCELPRLGRSTQDQNARSARG